MDLQSLGVCDRAQSGACDDFFASGLRRSAKNFVKTRFRVDGSEIGTPEMAFLSSDMGFWSQKGAYTSTEISGRSGPDVDSNKI